MKSYLKYFLITYLITHIIFLLLAIIVFRRADYLYGFIRLEIGAWFTSLIIAFAVWVFKLEKGKTVLNVILGYLILIPALFVMQNIFGTYVFRLSRAIYLLVVLIGIIYGVTVWIVSKRYKKEVDELNKMLEETKEKE